MQALQNQQQRLNTLEATCLELGGSGRGRRSHLGEQHSDLFTGAGARNKLRFLCTDLLKRAWIPH